MGRKMVILPGNADPTGDKSYPDEQGNAAKWPDGALHETVAREYARRLGCDAIVVHKSGWPQNETSPQTKAAMELFKANNDIAALYGFSGGGYNVIFILARLAREQPEALQGIHLVVVLGSPNKHHNGSIYDASNFNADAEKAYRKNHAKDAKPPPPWKKLDWTVVYRENPPMKELPPDVRALAKKAGQGTHMFGPEALLAITPDLPTLKGLLVTSIVEAAVEPFGQAWKVVGSAIGKAVKDL